MSKGEPGGSVGRAIGVKDIACVLAASWLRILLFAVVACTTAALAVQFMPRKFTATASVIIDPASSITLSQTARSLEPIVEMGMRIESQVEVIASVSVTERVIEKLGLVDDTEFDPLGARSRIDSPGSRDPAIAPAAPAPSQESAVTGLAEAHQSKVQSIVPGFLDRLVTRRVGRSTVIDIHFTSTSAEKAVRIVNAVADAYIEFDLDQKAQALRRGGVWLQGRLEELRRQSFESLGEAERFKRSGQGAISDSAVRLAELESKAQTFRRLYEGVHLQLMETLQRVSYPVADARILSLASVSRTSSQPKSLLIILFATMLGGAIGAIVSLIRMSPDGVVRSLEDVARSGRPTLGRVVSAGKSEKTWRWRMRSQPDLVPLPQHIGVSRAMRLIGEVRLAGLGVFDGKLNAGLSCIGIQGIGKQSTSSILCLLLARRYASAGKKVILVDACPDRGLLSVMLGLGDAPGLADMLSKPNGFDESFIVRNANGFDAIAAGSSASRYDALHDPPSEERIAAFMEKLLDRCDLCLLDLPTSGANALGAIEPFTNGTVLAVERGTLAIADLDGYLMKSQADAVSVIGTFLIETPLPTLDLRTRRPVAPPAAPLAFARQPVD